MTDQGSGVKSTQSTSDGLAFQVSGWQGAKSLHEGVPGAGKAVAYTGMMDCFVRTVTEEGASALFKVGVCP